MNSWTKQVKTVWLKRLLVFAGIVEIAVGLLHFVMPPFYSKAEGLANLNADEGDFVRLMTYAVGILLLAFGVLTLSFAREPKKHLDVVVPYLFIKCVLWTGRVCLELLYPVQLKMFGIHPFTMVVLPGVVAELVVFAVAAYLASQLRQDQLPGDGRFA